MKTTATTGKLCTKCGSAKMYYGACLECNRRVLAAWRNKKQSDCAALAGRTVSVRITSDGYGCDVTRTFVNIEDALDWEDKYTERLDGYDYSASLFDAKTGEAIDWPGL